MSPRIPSSGWEPLPGSWARRVRTALWVVAGALLVALLVAVIVGFARRGETDRERVAAYIVEVNRAQVGVSGELARIDALYRRFGRTSAALEKQVPELERAERTLRRLRERVAAITPPDDARRLHTQILRLLDLDVQHAGAVTGLARYLPALAEAQAPLAGTTERFRRDVERAKTAAEQARAFRRFAARTRAIAARVEQLDAPSYFEETQRREVTRLRRLAAVSVDVERALEAGDAEEAARLFTNLGTAASPTPVSRAEREAAIAYNRRIREIGQLARAVQRERGRLDRTVA